MWFLALSSTLLALFLEYMNHDFLFSADPYISQRSGCFLEDLIASFGNELTLSVHARPSSPPSLAPTRGTLALCSSWRRTSSRPISLPSLITRALPTSLRSTIPPSCPAVSSLSACYIDNCFARAVEVNQLFKRGLGPDKPSSSTASAFTHPSSSVCTVCLWTMAMRPCFTTKQLVSRKFLRNAPLSAARRKCGLRKRRLRQTASALDQLPNMLSTRWAHVLKTFFSQWINARGTHDLHEN